MPRLLIVTPSHSLHGGVERIIESLATGLPDHGFDVIVALAAGATWHNPDRFRAEHPGLRTLDIDGTSGVRVGRLRGLRQVLTQARPDLVLNARLFDAYEAVKAYRAGGGPPLRLAVTIQVYEPEYISDIAAYGDLVDCCVTSGQLIAAAVKKFSSLEPDRVVSIAGGVRPAEQLVERRPEQLIRLGYVGRLEHEQKRVLDVVDTLAWLREWQVAFECRIVGAGAAEADLQRAVSERHLDPLVAFEGWKSPADLYRDTYPAIDVLLHFAEWEGITIAPREAMAHGAVPVISRFLGLNAEGHFRHGENCLTFEVGDVLSAAHHVRRLAEDAALWRRLSFAARRSEEGEWSEEGALRAWARAFHRTLEHPPAGPGEAAGLRPPASGRLARLLGEGAAERVRSLLGRRALHADPGGEWPHCSGLSSSKALAEIADFGRSLDQANPTANAT